METCFRLPDLGEGLVDAEIIAWHVTVGDHVVADQPLVSVETDKAVVEIPSPRAGHIASLHASVGDRIEVGALLVEFETSTTDKGAVVGELGHAPTSQETSQEESRPPQPPSSQPPRAIKASPAVRRRAAELGVDLTKLQPSGPDGVLIRADIEAAASASGEVPGEPLRGVRRAMFTRMSEAHARVVPATVTGEADVESWPADTRPLSRLVRAVGIACHAEPRLNVTFDEGTMTIRPQDRVYLGLATETADGLFVPVLRDVTNRTPSELDAEIDRIKSEVDARTIATSELSGQSITLSNFGAVGGLHASMVVVPPQVAIVGAGRMSSKVVLLAGHASSHRTLPLSITFDHRVVTGAEASRFLNALIADLELSK